MRLFLPDRTVDLDGQRVVTADEVMHLTARERELLAFMLARAPAPVSRDALLEQVWRISAQTPTRCVDTAIRRLRLKLEADPSKPQHLLKVHGEGYRLVLHQPAPAAPPLAAGQAELPPPPRLIGREDEAAELAAALLEAAVVTLVGPPAAGLTALALVAAHRVGGRFTQVRLGGVDPGAGALWLRDAGPGVHSEATQLYTGAARGLPGERLVFVPALDEGACAQLLPEADALRVEVGGLPGVLVWLQAQGGELLGPGLVQSFQPSRRVPEACRPALTTLATAQAPTSLAELDALAGESALPLARAGWLQRQGSGWGLPFTTRLQLSPPGPEARGRHAAWVIARAARHVAGEVAPWADIYAAATWASAQAPSVFIQLEDAWSAELHLRAAPAEHLGWLDAALRGTLTGAERARGLVIRAETQRKLGRLRAADADLDAAEALSTTTLQRGRARSVRAMVRVTGGEPQAARRLYLDAAEALAEVEPARAAMCHIEAAFLRFGFGEHEAAILEGRAALRLAQDVAQDPYLLSYCEAKLGRMLSDLGWHWEGIPRLRQAVAHDRRLRAHHYLTSSLWHLGLALTDAGERAEGRAAFEEGRRLCEAQGLALSRALLISGAGVSALLDGELEQARGLLQESIVGYEDAQQSHRSWYPLAWLSLCCARLGDMLSARLSFERSAQLAGDRPARARFLALIQSGWAGPTTPETPPEAASDPELRILLQAIAAG